LEAVRKGGLLVAILSATLLSTGCSAVPERSAAQIAADDATATRVYAALDRNPTYYFRHVDVTVRNGVARLSGIVWTTDALYHAQRIARAVPGVIAVDDELELSRAARRGGGDG
jgi:osmotically-inducible protein OsmY